MIYGIFADPRGKCALFEGSLELVNQTEVDRIVCLGNIIKDGASIDEKRLIYTLKKLKNDCPKFFVIGGDLDFALMRAYEANKGLENLLVSAKDMRDLQALGFFHFGEVLFGNGMVENRLKQYPALEQRAASKKIIEDLAKEGIPWPEERVRFMRGENSLFVNSRYGSYEAELNSWRASILMTSSEEPYDIYVPSLYLTGRSSVVIFDDKIESIELRFQ